MNYKYVVFVVVVKEINNKYRVKVYKLIVFWSTMTLKIASSYDQHDTHNFCLMNSFLSWSKIKIFSFFQHLIKNRDKG